MRKNNKKMKRQEEILLNKSGITLIALVVTIVVLLILVGITISTLFGENGVITAARRAEQDTKQGEVDTNEKLQNIEDQMHGQLGIDTSSLAKLISANSFVTAEQGNQIVSDKTGKTMIVPVGFKIAEDSSNEIDKGVVIEDKVGNQYVWVPVSDSQFNDMFSSTVSGSTTNYSGKLYNFTTTSKGDPINVAIGSNSGNREPDILIDTTYGDASTGTANANYNGIAQLKSVVGITPDSGVEDENENILDKWNNQLQTKFNEMAKSVKQYKGFYVGRYEVSSLNTANPKTVKGVEPSRSINWYNMYKNMQGIETYTNSGVQTDVVTNMIWGCQWDRTLDWIATTDTKIGYAGLKNSTSWGNYYDSETFEYTKTDGTKGIKNKGTSWSDGILIPTGSTERNKANNIYDLAGNISEWTMEASSTKVRASRGGYYSDSGSSGPASIRYYFSPSFSLDPYSSDYDRIGSRPTLYVLSNI